MLSTTRRSPLLALKQVEQSHVGVVTVPGTPAIDEKLQVIAQATHHEAQGEALRNSLHQALAALPPTPLNKRVLFILSHGGMTVAAGATDRRGCGNTRRRVAERHALGLYTAISRFRRVMASQPDLVVISQDGLNALGGEENL